MTYEHGQSSFKIDSYVDKDLKTIELVQTDTISGAIQRHIMLLRDEATRQALIELGWTPPTDEDRTNALAVAILDAICEIHDTDIDYVEPDPSPEMVTLDGTFELEEAVRRALKALGQKT